jgi:hypothetical protein
MGIDDGIIWKDDPYIGDIIWDLARALHLIEHMLPLCDIVLTPAVNEAARHLLTKYQEALPT